MRFIYFCAFLLLIASTTFAQSPFTAKSCFQLNDSAALGFAVVSQSFDGFILQTGNDYTWDFTTTGTPGPWTSWTSPTASYNFRPSTQSNHTPFAATDFNEYALLPFARDHFYTYSPTKDTLYCDGFYTSSNKVYLPRIPYLSFPLTFNDSVSTFTEQTGGTALGPGVVIRSWVYDGFGSVRLPYGTENNVYRIRTKQVDSSTVLHSVLATTEELIWFRQSDGIPILRFVKQGPTTIAAYYASVSGASGISENQSDHQLTLYPNPFDDKIVVSNLSDQPIEHLAIYNTLGKCIMANTIPDNTIDTRTLSAGVYTIKITLKDKSKLQRKLVKANTTR